MKHVIGLALMLNLGVAGLYANERPVKMTFSGTSGPTLVNLQYPNTAAISEYDFAGNGTLGAFTFRTETNYKNDRQVQLRTLQNIYSQAGNWPMYEGLIRKATLKALAGSDQLQAAVAAYRSPVEYPSGNPLANQLQMVAQVIAGGSPSATGK